MNGIYIHSVGVLFLLDVMVVSVVLEGKEWIASSFGDLIGLFPNVFEVECLCVPFFLQCLGWCPSNRFFS